MPKTSLFPMKMVENGLQNLNSNQPPTQMSRKKKNKKFQLGLSCFYVLFHIRNQPVQVLMLSQTRIMHSLTLLSEPRAKNPEVFGSGKKIIGLKKIKEKLTCLPLVSKEKKEKGIYTS